MKRIEQSQLDGMIAMHRAWYDQRLQSQRHGYKDPVDSLRADFSGMDLSGLNLAGANLNHAYATGTSFRGVNLKGAQLMLDTWEGADFRDAILEETYLGNINVNEVLLPAPRVKVGDVCYWSKRQYEADGPLFFLREGFGTGHLSSERAMVLLNAKGRPQEFPLIVKYTLTKLA